MTQILYGKENIHLNFIATYAMMNLEKDHLYFVNTLTDQRITLFGTEEILQDLFEGLQHGIADEKLLALLRSIGAERQYDVLLQEGLVE